MTLSVAEITTRVQRQFGDEANSQITQADIIRWINDAMREIVHRNKLLQVKATTDTLTGVRSYALPSDISKLYSIQYNGVQLTNLSMAEVDSLVGNKDITTQQGYPTGVPTHYYIWADQINLYPAPDRNMDEGLSAYYSRTATQVADGTDIPEVPDEYHNRILEYCLAQAYELDENFEQSAAKMAVFEQKVTAQNSIDEQQQELYPFITTSEDEDCVNYYA